MTGKSSSSSIALHATGGRAASLVLASRPPRPLPDLSTIRGVLFDIDGTLTNSDPLHQLA